MIQIDHAREAGLGFAVHLNLRRQPARGPIGEAVVAGITGFRRTTFEESFFLALPILHSGRVSRLRRRRGRPGSYRVEDRIGGEAWCGSHLGLRHWRGLLRARAKERRRGRSRFGFLAQSVVRVVTGCRMGSRHWLLRLHDGRTKITRQRRPYR